MQVTVKLFATLARLREEGISGKPFEVDLADNATVADLINFLATIEDGTISVIFVEQKEGNVKVSWRAQPGIDVSKIALRFGGGGHPAAAGAMIAGTMDAVQQQVLAETLTLFQKPAEVQGDTSPA